MKKTKEVIDKSELKKLYISMSLKFYYRLSEIAGQMGTTPQQLALKVIKDWYYSEKWKEVDNAYNIEMRIDKIVRSRVSEPISEILEHTKMIVDALERGHGNLSFEREPPEEDELQESEAEEVEGEDEEMPDVSDEKEATAIEERTQSLNELFGDVFGYSSQEKPSTSTPPAPTNAIGEKEKSEFQQYLDAMANNKFKSGEKFGDIKGDSDVPDEYRKEFEEDRKEEEIREKVLGSREEKKEAKHPPRARDEEENEKEPEGGHLTQLTQSKIRMVDGHPEVEGLKIVLRAGDRYFYDDGSIWIKGVGGEGGKWWKRGKKLIKILEEEELI